MKKVHINIGTCKGCQLCIDACKINVLEMSEEKNVLGVLFPKVSKSELCNGCMQCAVVCPECSIEIVLENE